MKKKYVILWLLATFNLAIISVYGQDVRVVGTVVDSDTKEAVSGANVFYGSEGVVTDDSGKFTFSTTAELPISLNFSFIGYKTEIINITEAETDLGVIELVMQAFKTDEVVVSASRIKESLLKAPVSIETMGVKEIENSPSASFYDGVANLKGVQPNVGSLLYASLNTRGFADPNNLRFIQLLDGASIVTPAFGVIGNTAGVSELDVEGVELVPGASSALYGANAFNGLLLIKTKDPFKTQGISMVTKTGYTVQERGTDPYTQFSLRIAEDLIEDKLAIKIDFETIQAIDWQKVAPGPKIANIANQEKNENYLINNPITNPAWDQNDRYGEDDSQYEKVTLTGPTGKITKVDPLRRTGVAEKDIFNLK